MTSKRIAHASDITLMTNTFVLNKSDELIIIWFDDTIDPEIQQTLNEIHTHTDTCSTIEQFTNLISNLSDYKIMLIVAGRYSHEILTHFHHSSKIESIFIFCMDKQLYQHLLDDTTNVKLSGIYTEYKSLFQSIDKRLRSLLKHLSIFKIIEHTNKSVRNLEHESAYYAWYQLLRDSLLSIEPETSKKEMLEYCRFYYAKDPISLKQIDEFEQTYNSSESVRWYTNNYFPFNFINKALRSEDVNALYNLRYFIICLSKQLKKLYDEGCSDMQDAFNPYLKVYRGLTLSNEDIIRLKTFVNRYVCTNGFLSTSLSRDVAEMFAANVLFEILVDPKQTSNNLTYAYIAPYSQVPHEQEVLFDLGATFKITDVKSDGNQCIVSMIAVTDIDCIKNIYIDKERDLLQRCAKEMDENFQSILTFGIYLMHMGQYNNSITFLRNLRNRTRLYEYERYFVLKALARSHMNNDEQDLALQYALEAYQINRFVLPNEMKDIELLLGRIYSHREEYDLALECYQRVMNEGGIDDSDITLEIHTNMALIHFSNNNLTDGFEHSQTLLQMLHDSDSFDPVGQSDAYIVIARGYYLTDNYEMAIEYDQKALSIRTAIFPDNHPVFPLTYNELADFYDENKQYDLAIEYYMKSVGFYEKYSPDSDLLYMKMMILSNIARCYGLMKQFDLSRLNFEKALEIQERITPYNEMTLADFHEKIAICYWSVKDYDLTILHYQMASELRKKISSNSAQIVQLYKRIGACFDEKHAHESARENYQKALELQKELLPSDELLIGDLYTLIGSSYEKEKNYPSCIYYYRLTLTIRQKCSVNDAETIQIYKIIAKVYMEMNEYDLAIESLKKALEIHEMIDSDSQLTASDLHARLASYYKQNNEENLAIRHFEYTIYIYKNLQSIDYDILFSLYEHLSTLYYRQNDYSSASKVYEQMVEITENLKQTDPFKMAKFYSQMSETYCKLDCYSFAMDYCKKSMEIIERHCHNQYKLTAKNNEIFGTIYYYYKDKTLSENYYRKALELFQIVDADEDVKRMEKTLQYVLNPTEEVSSNENACDNSSSKCRLLLFCLFVVILLFFLSRHI